MSWDQIREVQHAGVEVASHTHDLHRYQIDNPAHDTAPAVSARLWLDTEHRYETREEYRSRIRADLEDSQRTLKSRLGAGATALVWPYGMHNEMARGLAEQSGFHTTLALGWRDALPQDFALHCLPRIMVTHDLRFAGSSLSWLRRPQGAMRAAEVSLDDLYDPNMTVCRARLDSMIVRLRAIGATHVLLDVCSNPVGDGRLRQVYLPGHQAPMRADLWSMVAAKLWNAKLKVWVRTPSMNLTWAWDRHPEWRLGTDPHPIASSAFGESAGALEARTTHRWPTRLSPELPDARHAAIDFFTDLAVYLPIEGVLFDDDAMLLPRERLASKPGASVAERAQAVDGMIADIETAVLAWRPECRFGRVGGSETVLADGAARETAQDFGRMLRTADCIVVRADAGDPAFARDPQRWVQVVARRAIERWEASEQTRIGDEAKRGIPASALQRVPPLMLELPIAGHAADGTSFAARLPALLAEGRRAGFESFEIGPVTPANAAAIPPRVLEANDR
jgi:biofilm PGA synthesis lipoprotein PgaB